MWNDEDADPGGEEASASLLGTESAYKPLSGFW